MLLKSKIVDNNENIDPNRNEFDWYIEELNKIYTNDKGRAKKIARKGLADLGVLNGSNNVLGIDPEMAKLVLVFIAFALCVFFVPSIEGIPIYLFGLIFFLAGVCVSLFTPLFGLIFLVSHGGTGLFLMLSALFGGMTDEPSILEIILNNPVFTDGGIPKNIQIYLFATIVVFATAIIFTILHNLSPRMKEDRKYMIRILLVYLLGIILVGLFPRVFSYLT